MPWGLSVIRGTTSSRTSSASTSNTAITTQVTTTVELTVTPPRSTRGAQMLTEKASEGLSPSSSCSPRSTRHHSPAISRIVGQRACLRVACRPEAAASRAMCRRHRKPPAAMARPRTSSAYRNNSSGNVFNPSFLCEQR